jgi:hypothetical protein
MPTARQPTYEKVNEELFLDNPLHVILNNSKLAYRIYVILIANKDLIKKMPTARPFYWPQQQETCWHRHPLNGHGTVLVDEDLSASYDNLCRFAKMPHHDQLIVDSLSTRDDIHVPYRILSNKQQPVDRCCRSLNRFQK